MASTGWIAEKFDYSKYTSAELTGSAVPTAGQAVFNGLTRALPSGFKTDVQVLSDFRLGTYLRRHGNLTGDQASLLDGAIDFVRDSRNSTSPHANFSIDYTKNFIPIIIKTQFNIDKTDSILGKPFYVVFDSTPETISFGKSATWNPQEFYGRPEPIQIYKSSGAITFSLTGTFFSIRPEDHKNKLNLADRLFALTTPSKYRVMPSPVEVKIGEWKHLRCIVTDVKIDYKGPWWISSSVNDTQISTSSGTILNQADYNMAKATSTISLPSYAPYLFDATFTFTVVSEFNNVQYAEDIIKSGWNGGILEGPADRSEKNIDNFAVLYGKSFNTFTVSDMAGSIISNNQKEIIDDSKWSNITYLNSLGLPSDASGGSKLAAMTQITSGLTAITTGIINNNYGKRISKLLGK